MAGARKDSRLTTATARLRLKAAHQPYWTNIAEGVALGYRRGPHGGSWYWRRYAGNGRYEQAFLGTADDHLEANGDTVLSYYQAQESTRKAFDQANRERGVRISHKVTVKEATEHYLRWFRANRKSVAETEHAVHAHILPALGEKQVAALRAPDLRTWLNDLAAQPARVRSSQRGRSQRFKEPPKTDEEKRARRATANRILTVLKAVLNKAFEDNLVADNVEWRKVRPFGKVDEARIRFLSDAEATRLINACPTDLRTLVRGALLTGARYRELATLRAQDFHHKSRQLYFRPSKSDRARHVPLNDEGVALFKRLVAGKTTDALVFRKKDGTEWGKNHHVRPLRTACAVAKVRPVVRFHELRHTYASHLAQASIDLLTISKLLGHADIRITSRHYAHLADRTLSAAVTKLPSFLGDSASALKESLEQVA